MTAKEQLIPEIDLICLLKNRDRAQPEASATTSKKYWVRLVG